MAMPRKIEIVLGMEFGLLTAASVPYRVKEKENKLYCKFKCVCGKIKEIRTYHVISGAQKSCGCVRPNRLEEGEAAFNGLFGSYKYHATARGINFALTKEEAKELTKKNCMYCGVEPSKEFRSMWRKGKVSSPYVYNGIDRSDNELGYTVSNCVPCCFVCNIAKRSMSLAEFMAWIDRLVKFRTQQNTESPATVQGNVSKP